MLRAVLVVVSLAAATAFAACSDSPVVAPTLSPLAPNAPTGLTARIAGPSQALTLEVTLTWTAPIGGLAPDDYVIELGTPSVFAPVTTVSAAATSKTLTFDAIHWRTLAWRVRAVKAAVSSDPSNQVSYTFALPPSEGSLAAPDLISPADRTVFSHFPRTTTLVWHPVAGAVGYGFEIDYCSQSNPWCLDETRTEIIAVVGSFSDTSYPFAFIGAQPGRWCVWAVDPAGRQGTKSPWRSFLYTQ